MHALIVLLLAGAAACAVPRPLGASAAPEMSRLPRWIAKPRPVLRDYIMPRMLLPRTAFAYEESPAYTVEHDWLNKEIDRINQMDEEDAFSPIDLEFSQFIPEEPYISRPRGPFEAPEPVYTAEGAAPSTEEFQPMPPPREIYPSVSMPESQALLPYHHETSTISTPSIILNEDEKKKTFALTPLDKEYYEPDGTMDAQNFNERNKSGESKPYKAYRSIEFERPRSIRQSLDRTKNLVADNLNVLRTGFTQENQDGTDRPSTYHILEHATDPAESIYGIAIIAAVGAALAMAIVGFAFGWYTLSKKAKAAADVDYPAYGVTGPTIDISGDRKLAHSAHMYHYQHQKQQIIAMERSGLDHRNGSVSDPESEEENEEGDYTVYECPGFATTGEMEVKNPLFNEDPTPATPGKCEIVKPQPKD